MRNHRLARGLIYVGFLLAVAPGCQTFHSYRPMAIEARDAETKQPIPGVAVKISYPLETSSFAPAESTDTTGTDGIARVRAAPYGRAGVLVDVSAKGYMNAQKYLSIEEVQAIEGAHWFEDVSRRPAAFVLEMFADPAPVVELVVRPGFRGHFKAKVTVEHNMPCQPGQRLFRYEVPPSAEVAATGPPVFRYLTTANVHVEFADNSPLSQLARESDVGYWLLKTEGTTYYFLVGTQREYDLYRQNQPSSGSGKQSRGGGRGAGGGRRGRKGGSSSGDPDSIGGI